MFAAVRVPLLLVTNKQPMHNVRGNGGIESKKPTDSQEFIESYKCTNHASWHYLMKRGQKMFVYSNMLLWQARRFG